MAYNAIPNYSNLSFNSLPLWQKEVLFTETLVCLPVSKITNKSDDLTSQMSKLTNIIYK